MSDWPGVSAAASQEWTRINTTVLASAAASITVSGIDTDYRKFRLTLYVIKDGTGGLVQYRFNGDSGTNYALEYILANSTTVSAERQTGQTQLSLARAISFTANDVGVETIEVSKPLATTPARVTASASIISTNIRYEANVGEWNNTADAISSITILVSAGNFAANTRVLTGGSRDTV